MKKEVKKPTIIINPMGKKFRGYLVNDKDICKACPYWVADIHDRYACYADTFKNCEHRKR